MLFSSSSGKRPRWLMVLRNGRHCNGRTSRPCGLGFPRDLPVGTVSKVATPPGSLFQEVEVTPAVDFTRLTEVLVLLAPPAEPLLVAPAPGSAREENAPTATPVWPSRGLSFYR